MRKILTFALVLSLGALLLTGCQTAQQPATTPPVSQQAAAESLGALVCTGLRIDNITLGAVGIASARGVSAATALTTPNYEEDGWWHASFTYTGGINIDVYFRVWKVGNVEITNPTDLANLDLDDVDKISMFTTYTMGSTIMSFGTSKSNSLTYSGVGVNSTLPKSIDGPVSLQGIDEDGTSFTITITYNNVSLSSSGYPSGTVNFSVTSGGTEVITGSISFDGDETATLTFTSGYSGSYTVNLLTGTVTPASI